MMRGIMFKWLDIISLFYAELAEKLHLPRIGKYNNNLLILQLNKKKNVQLKSLKSLKIGSNV